jgi:phage tail sheath gpL-like
MTPNARVHLRSRRVGAVNAVGELRGFVRCNDSFGGVGRGAAAQIQRAVTTTGTLQVYVSPPDVTTALTDDDPETVARRRTRA